MQDVSEGDNGIGYYDWRWEEGPDFSVQGIVKGHKSRRMHKVPSAGEPPEGGMEHLEEGNGPDSNFKTVE